jgi:2,4-dienoyl-CoA reductase-like NADH-dependent reductase (Old Yellow Enzyme family)
MIADSQQLTATLSKTVRLNCGLVLQNRIAKAATTEHFADSDGNPTSDHYRLYSRWAVGGAGLLITGNACIDEAQLEGPGNVFISNRTRPQAFEDWVKAARTWNTPMLLQLVHPGALALGPEPVSPSGVWIERMRGHFARPRALQAKEIRTIIAKFAHAAEFARETGFAGIEIHAAHGFLLSQFLSPRTNLRTDEWGRTPLGRRKLLLEVVRESRAALGPNLALAVKINTADYVNGGFDDEASVEALTALDSENVDLIELSGGSYEQPAMWGANNKGFGVELEGHFLPHAQQARRLLHHSAIMVTGGFRTALAVSEALASGDADMVGLARSLIADPDLPRRWTSGDVQAVGPWPTMHGTVFDKLAWFQSRMKELAT